MKFGAYNSLARQLKQITIKFQAYSELEGLSINIVVRVEFSLMEIDSSLFQIYILTGNNMTMSLRTIIV